MSSSQRIKEPARERRQSKAPENISGSYGKTPPSKIRSEAGKQTSVSSTGKKDGKVSSGGSSMGASSNLLSKRSSEAHNSLPLNAQVTGKVGTGSKGSSHGSNGSRHGTGSSTSEGTSESWAHQASPVMSDSNVSPAPPSKGISRMDSQKSMILACHLQQAMYRGKSLSCYRIVVKKSDTTAPANIKSTRTAVEDVIKSKISDTNCCILTDYQEYLVSTSVLEDAWTVMMVGRYEVQLQFVETVPWPEVLRYLNSAKLLDKSVTKDGAQCKEGPSREEAVRGIFKTLYAQSYPPKAMGNTEKTSPALLDVKMRNNMNRLNGDRKLSTLMEEFMGSGPTTIRQLETYLRGQRVHFGKISDNARQGGKRPTKTIIGLARIDDGRGNKAIKPPKVLKYGGCSLDVSFCLNFRGKGKGAIPVQFRNQFISVFDYFKHVKRQELQCKNLPLINIGSRSKPTYLPPELCEVVDPQPATAFKISYNDLEDVGRATVPTCVIQDESFVREWQIPGLKMLPKTAGLEFSIDMTARSMLAPCRRLQAPELVYPDGNERSTTSGSWKMDKLNFNNGKPCRLNILLVNDIPTGLKADVARAKIGLKADTAKAKTGLLAHLHDIGLPTQEDSFKTINKPYGVFNKEIKSKITDKIADLAKGEPDAILVLLPPKAKALYDHVKRKCDLEAGVQDICMMASNFADDDKHSFLPIGLKLNLKAGHIGQKLKVQDFNPIDLRSSMVVGFDIISPTRHAHAGARSIAAMVTSCDSTLAQWPAAVEVLDDKPVNEVLAQLLMGRLETWKKYGPTASQGAGQYPKNIIIYRNGLTVVDEKACEAELRSIEKNFEAKWAKDRGPKVTFIAVNKDHQAQLRIPKSLNQDTEKQTIPVHPIVVRTMDGGEKEHWEFVIQGHQHLSRNERAKNPAELEAKNAMLPVRYSVLKGDMFAPGPARENLENLTHAMSYLCGCNTSVVADTLPIYYVRLLTKRIQSWVRPWYQPNGRGDELEVMSGKNVELDRKVANKMFYI